MESELRDRVAIITGASRGIGREIALAYSRAGAHVTVSSRNIESVSQVAREIEMAGGQALAVKAHMGDANQVEALIRRTLDKWGRVDIAVNNAGTNPHFGPILTADEGQIDKILDINLKGYFRLCREVFPYMKDQGGGKIINISSIAGLRPSVNMGIYSISKAAVNMLTQVLARELGRYNIQVNAIAPGIVKTKFSRALWENEALMRRHQETLPLERMGQPQDLVGAALYLAASTSDWVTGTILVVDGGATVASGL